MAVKSLKFLLFATFLLIAADIPAGENWKPGEYIPDGGWGSLVIKTGGGKTLFEIQSIGANFHTCGLSGEIKNGRATLEAMDKPCVVTFKPQGGGIQVDSSGEECRYYCGMRAQFEGLYLMPPAGCDRKTKARTRADFKKLYDKKEYEKAHALLNPFFKTCRATFDWIETGWIQNDLAITQQKLGDLSGCRATLSSFKEDLSLSDEQIKDQYPPSDAELWLPVVKAARFNLKLCSKERAKK